MNDTLMTIEPAIDTEGGFQRFIQNPKIFEDNFAAILLCVI